VYNIEAKFPLQFEGKRAYKSAGGKIVSDKRVTGQRDPLASNGSIDRQRRMGKFSRSKATKVHIGSSEFKINRPHTMSVVQQHMTAQIILCLDGIVLHKFRTTHSEYCGREKQFCV
jgi:hypothetical protein